MNDISAASRSTADRVTLVPDAIFDPDEPRHFMSAKPAGAHIRIVLGDTVLAESDRALRVLEVGKIVSRPVFYLPRGDVLARLERTDRSTVCPLKGRTHYFDLASDDGTTVEREIAWVYYETFEFSRILEDLVAFDGARVSVCETPFTR